MQYVQRKLHLSVTETRTLLISRPQLSVSGSITKSLARGFRPARSEKDVMTERGSNMDDAHKDQIEGKAKEVEGKLTDDKTREAEGKAQNAWGDAKEKADDVADEVRDRV
jgi:uncharacterized protein YjbJ (UPF0337 family)